MNIVVLTGSRHGGTRDIGDRLARSLNWAGHSAVSGDVRDAVSLDGVDAVVLGSAVYAGRWTDEALAFVSEFRADLTAIPTWIFSSGPIGNPPLPDDDPEGHVKVRDALQPVGDRVFPGVLNRARLGLLEKFITRAVHAQEGDFRDWDGVDAFAAEIDRYLSERAAPALR